MYTKDISYNRLIISALLILTVCISSNTSNANTYPQDVIIVSKTKAKYDTPENAYAAMLSSKFAEDISWYYSSYTKESAKEWKDIHKKHNIDLTKAFAAAQNTKKAIIIGKRTYRDGVLLIVKGEQSDGSIVIGPSYYIKEDGLWKAQKPPLNDPILIELLEYIPPPSILAPYALSIFPDEWSLTWYQWLLNHNNHKQVIHKFAKRTHVLCVLAQADTEIPIDEIDLPTLHLNNDVSVKPWRYFSWQSFKWESTEAVIIDPNNTNQSHYYTQFNRWQNKLINKIETEKPILLARFNTFEAMQSIDELQADTDYEIIISGKLKDGKEFEAKTTITVTKQKPPRRKWFNWKSRPPFHSDYIDLWWNE